MTAQTARHDAQTALTRPTTIQDLGRRITAENKAMRELLAVAENECRWHGGSEQLRGAVLRVQELRPAQQAAPKFEAPDLAAVLTQHLAQVWSSGGVECSCGSWKRMRTGDDWHAIRAHANHQAGMLVVAMAGGAA